MKCVAVGNARNEQLPGVDNRKQSPTSLSPRNVRKRNDGYLRGRLECVCSGRRDIKLLSDIIDSINKDCSDGASMVVNRPGIRKTSLPGRAVSEVTAVRGKSMLPASAQLARISELITK